MDTYETLDFFEAFRDINLMPLLSLLLILVLVVALIPVIVNMIYTYTVMKRLKEISTETKRIAMILERQNAQPRPNPRTTVQQKTQTAAPAQPAAVPEKTPTAPQP